MNDCFWVNGMWDGITLLPDENKSRTCFCKTRLCVNVCVKRTCVRVVGEMTDRVIKPANDGNQQHYRANQSLKARV